MRKSRPNSQTGQSVWISNAWVDLIVGCGAWSAPLLLLSYLSLSSSTRIWSFVFYGLAFFFNYPHYTATLYRAYHRAEDVEKYRTFTVHVTALVMVTLLVAHFWARLLPWIFTLYLTWSPWHYSGQNYGLFMMFARRAGANPNKRTRGALYGAFVASYLILFLSFHTGPSNDPLFLSLNIPSIVGRWEQLILGAAFVGLAGYGLTRLARETGWRKLTPSLTLFSSQFLWFLLPAGISLVRGLEIPQSRYSTGILAVMHSAQYLWITSYYARREAANESSSSKATWKPFAYFGVLILGGIALFVPGPWLASRAFHHDFTASFLIFTALVNIHHFILDGVIWKLRDRRVASLLLNSRERIAQATSRTGSHIASVWQWCASSVPTAKWLRVGVAVVLLAWGTVDQVRYYLALHSDNIRDLQRAAALNSFDSVVQLDLGRKEYADGDSGQAESSLRRAVQVNPADPVARQELLKLLLEQKQYDEALQVTESALKYFPKDPNLLVDRGLLNVQLGYPNAARADWDRALLLDHTQWLPHLYLAQELEREGEPRAAASHYATFLEKIGQQDPQRRPSPDLVIGVALRMADCQAKSAQPDLAVKSYQLAAKLANLNANAKLESIADVNSAELQAKAGKVNEALQLYQRALRLDEMAGDNQAGALDWFAYSRFLDQSGMAQWAYVSLKKSESLQQTLKNPVLPAAETDLRKRLEAQLTPEEIASTTRDLEATARQAITLRR